MDSRLPKQPPMITLTDKTSIVTRPPHGVSAARKPPVFLQSGDTVTLHIEKIEALTNPVAAEKPLT